MKIFTKFRLSLFKQYTLQVNTVYSILSYLLIAFAPTERDVIQLY